VAFGAYPHFDFIKDKYANKKRRSELDPFTGRPKLTVNHMITTAIRSDKILDLVLNRDQNQFEILNGQREIIAIASLLHDIVEDDKATRGEVENCLACLFPGDVKTQGSILYMVEILTKEHNGEKSDLEYLEAYLKTLNDPEASNSQKREKLDGIRSAYELSKEDLSLAHKCSMLIKLGDQLDNSVGSAHTPKQLWKNINYLRLFLKFFPDLEQIIPEQDVQKLIIFNPHVIAFFEDAIANVPEKTISKPEALEELAFYLLKKFNPADPNFRRLGLSLVKTLARQSVISFFKFCSQPVQVFASKSWATCTKY
jgi:hypothetical protein